MFFMKLFITGSTGYIGRHLIPLLLKQGHFLVILARDLSRIDIPSNFSHQVSFIKGDLLIPSSLQNIPKDIEAAYYLVHSMHQSNEDFSSLEETCAQNFVKLINATSCKQVIYLSGLARSDNLSPHFSSRHHVEEILKKGKAALTTLRSSIIIGSGSASFEIMRDLVEKLPIMIAPKWIKSRSQPIAISDALDYLIGVLGLERSFNQTFEIGGPDILSYKEMLLKLAELRHLRRWIITVPVLTPRLSSYWLYFITSTNYNLAKTLVESLINDSICQNTLINKIVPKKCLSFEESIKRALYYIEENPLIASWKNSLVLSDLNPDLQHYIQVPQHGCLVDVQEIPFPKEKLNAIALNIWSIGGNRGWYYWNWAWRLRGWIDKFVGGVGLRRGRAHPFKISVGDALDFWRVLLADKKEKRLLLYAEMQLPGEAWLELKIVPHKNGYALKQTATFRPSGLLGRFYWWLLYPFHSFIFRGMAEGIIHTPPLPLKEDKDNPFSTLP